MKIYLAGGMYVYPTECFEATLKKLPHPLLWLGGREEIAWVDIVTHILPPGHHIFDPRSSLTKVFADYSFLDLLELRQCDLVIAYLEATNPSGAGLIAEVAFAKGLGKTVLLINEKADRSIRFVENFADRIFHELSDAVPVLSRIQP